MHYVTDRDAKFLARSPSAWATVVARQVKGVFVNRRYKKGEPFLLKIVLLKREGEGLELWAKPPHTKLCCAPSPPSPPPPPNSSQPWANPLYCLRHDFRNYCPGENLQYTCSLNSKNLDSRALRYPPPSLE